MKVIKFEKGIRKLKAQVIGDMKITKDGVEFLNGLCNDINTRLVDDCKQEFQTAFSRKSEGELNLTQQHVGNVVKKTFKKRLKEHAVAEGEKAVFKYINELLEYDPKKALQPVRRSNTNVRPKKHVLPNMLFANRLQVLLNNVHKDVFITARARKVASNTLHNIVNKLTAKTAQAAKERASKGKASIGVEDVAAAIESMLGELMLYHARSEGENSVRMYNDGILHFKPTRRRERRPFVTSDITESGQQVMSRESFHNIFNTGIRHLATDVHNGCPINGKAVKKTDGFLTKVAIRLGTTAVNRTIKEERSQVTPMEMHVALTDVMPPDLCDYAKTEGDRAVMLFRNDLIHFKPKPYKPRKHPALRSIKRPHSRARQSGSPGRKRAKMHSKHRAYHRRRSRITSSDRTAKVPQPDFCLCLSDLLREIDDAGTINRKASDMINSSLLGVTKKLASHSAALAGKRPDKMLTPAEVRAAVIAEVPKTMKEHAVAQGDKELTCYSSGVGMMKPHTNKLAIVPPAIVPAQAPRVSMVPQKRAASKTPEMPQNTPEKITAPDDIETPPPDPEMSLDTD